MNPAAVNPTITLEQLFKELAAAHNDQHRREVRDRALAKLQRRLRRLPAEARKRYEAEAGETPEATAIRLKNALAAICEWVKARPTIGRILDRDQEGNGDALPVAHHPDEVIAISHCYGNGVKPQVFLDGFSTFVRDNLDKIVALTVVMQRPRDLTRAELRGLRFKLDKLGYAEAAFRTAWHDARNEDIAASIVGFIRQAALGDPLITYADRVAAAMRQILASRPWTEPQRTWLKRIGEQVEKEIVVDRDTLDQGVVSRHGRRLRTLEQGV